MPRHAPECLIGSAASVRVDLANESSVLNDTAQQVPETCISVSQTVSTNSLPLQSPHSSARFVDCDDVDSRQEPQQASDELVVSIHINRLTLHIRLKTPGN